MKLYSNNKIAVNFYRIISILFFSMWIFSSCDQTDIYDNIKELSKDEIVYPAMFDTVFTTIGYQRVEIDLRKEGRIPASQMNLSKAKKTVVVYDENSPSPTIIEIDSVCSWVNITGLTEPRIYRFKIYTVDEFGSRSTPQEVSVVPYTEYDLNLMKQGILDPSIVSTPTSMIMEWPTGLNSIVMEYHGMQYEYINNDSLSISGLQHKNPRIFASNLPAGEEVSFNMTYKVVPLLDDGTKLKDTIEVSKPLVVQMPTLEQEFIPQELRTLRANGISDFRTSEILDIESLTYPMDMGSFADLFYFPNIKSIDLTGKGLKNILPRLTYSKNNETSIVGGGDWQEFMVPSAQPRDINVPEGLQTLKDLLDARQITNITYIPKSLGLEFDEFIEPYVESGVVELLTYENDDKSYFPDVVFVQPQFFANGLPGSPAFEMKHSYSGDFLPRPGLTDFTNFDPESDIVNGKHIDLKLDQLIQSDGSNIYRNVIVAERPTLLMALPREYRFDNKRYKYMKFKMFIGNEPSLISNVGGNNRHLYRDVWVRMLNHFSQFKQNSDYGQGYWHAGYIEAMTDAEIQNSWHEYTIDMSRNDGGDNSNIRNRAIKFNFGHESRNIKWTYDENNEIVIYIADVRFTKTIND